MSWILGIVNQRNNSRKEIPQKIHKECSQYIEKENIQIFIGDSGKNCLYRTEGNATTTWGIAGTGIKTTQKGIRICTKEDWDEMLGRGKIDCDGHYCGFQIKANEIKLFTDVLGLRDFYLLPLKNRLIFSTRIDLLGIFEKLKIDFEVFGSTWLCVNNFSVESIYKPLIRIFQGTQVYINSETLTYKVEKKQWCPTRQSTDKAKEVFIEELKNFVFPGKDELILGLSGGLDSRVLLSLFMNNPNRNWRVQTSGPITEPDCLIAEEIAKKLELQLIRNINEGSSGIISIEDMKNFCFQTRVNHPISSYFALKVLDYFEAMESLFVDGGFGEIWRREYFNRLILTGKNAVLEQNPRLIAQKLISSKAKIFNEEVETEMARGCEKQFATLIEYLPTLKEIGMENWLDLVVVKTRLPNYYGVEQARIDSKMVSFMPYAQPRVLNRLLQIDIKERKNGRLFRQMISTNFPALNKYGLVKGNYILPYNATTLYARLNTMIRKRISKNKQGGSLDLSKLKEWSLDNISSAEFSAVHYYDHNAVKNIVEEYYLHNSVSRRSEIEWWLSFEMARQYMDEIGEEKKTK